MSPIILLAQEEFVTPLEKYFSFFVLGVLVCIGYIIVRTFNRKKKKDEGERTRLEDQLYRVEAEARAAHAARMQQAPEPARIDEPALGFTPEQEMERQKVRELLARERPPLQEDSHKTTTEGPP